MILSSEYIILTNGNFNVRLENFHLCYPLFKRLIEFFTPFFAATEKIKDIHLTIEFHSNEEFPTKWIQRYDETMIIRRSTAFAFNLTAVVNLIGDHRLAAWDTVHEVGYIIDRKTYRVEFYGGENAFIHLIELIRYYGLIVEQGSGTIILHGAAVLNDEDKGSVDVIIGQKGNGKTTTMLRKVLNQGARFFSGDKVLLNIRNNKLVVRGWPDYPHIGIGTLSEFPEFAEKIGIVLTTKNGIVRDFYEKILVDPTLFYKHLPMSNRADGFLERLILPDIKSTKKLKRYLIDSEKNAMALLNFVEFPHEFRTATWHGMKPVNFEGRPSISSDIGYKVANIPWQIVN